MHAGVAEGVTQHSTENEPVVRSFASAAAPVLHPVDSSYAVKVLWVQT